MIFCSLCFNCSDLALCIVYRLEHSIDYSNQQKVSVAFLLERRVQSLLIYLSTYSIISSSAHFDSLIHISILKLKYLIN